MSTKKCEICGQRPADIRSHQRTGLQGISGHREPGPTNPTEREYESASRVRRLPVSIHPGCAMPWTNRWTKQTSSGLRRNETDEIFDEYRQQLSMKVISRFISRAEALRIARKILEQAERERLIFAEYEAARGIQWENHP